MKRIKVLSAIFALLFIIISARIFIIAVINHKHYSKAAAVQRKSETVVRTARKIIYDRNMIPLTESTSQLYAVVICEKVNSPLKVATLLDITLPKKGIKTVPMPEDKAIQKELLSCKGVSALSMPVRYYKDNLFCHLIGYGGYTNGSGLEKALDGALITNRALAIVTAKSAKSQPLWTQGYYNPNEKDLSGVRITADLHIQRICESVMDELCPKGAVVVADVKTGDILAMASRPAYSQDNPSAYFGGGGSELLNRAISSYDMGSVFKIIVAGVALEEGIVTPESIFNCTGECTIGEVDFHCHKRDGHGSLTFEEAFAQSCNMPFYQLGQQLGWDIIRRYAEKSGLGKNIIDLALDESHGKLPLIADSAPALANLSIGQGEMSGTPLQVAQIVQIVGNGGIKHPLSIIDGRIKKDGSTMIKSIRASSEKVFSTKTALILQKLMKATVAKGTGTPAQSSIVSIGGKTGSAETGWQEDGETMTHGWFAGFFPADRPQYACVVLCENGKWGGSGAGPVFKKIAEQIVTLY